MPKRRMYSPLNQHSIVFMLYEGLIYLLLALARQFELGIARIEVAHSLSNRISPEYVSIDSNRMCQGRLNNDISAAVV